MSEGGLLDIKSRSMQPGSEKTSAYQPLLPGQTVCTVKNEKGQNCAGHVKQWLTASADIIEKAAPENTIHRCQRCYLIYEGPPQEYLYPKIKK